MKPTTKPQTDCPCRDLSPSDASATERLTHRSAASGERVCKVCHRVLYSAAWLSRPAVAAAMSWTG